MRSIKLIIGGVVLVAALSTVATGANLSGASGDDEERLPMGADGSLFLAGTVCGPNEVLAPGSLPTCEPTCKDPKPVCPKVFFAGIDYVPCFCKSPLVRNTETKQCVQISECPSRRAESSRPTST